LGDKRKGIMPEKLLQNRAELRNKIFAGILD
jgi:hypothetical protein